VHGQHEMVAGADQREVVVGWCTGSARWWSTATEFAAPSWMNDVICTVQTTGTLFIFLVGNDRRALLPVSFLAVTRHMTFETCGGRVSDFTLCASQLCVFCVVRATPSLNLH
jgi:hypothetical protein